MYNMRYILIALLFLSCSKNEIDQVREQFQIPDIESEKPGMDVKTIFGAVGNGVADDWEPLQRAIDSAVKTNGKVYIPAGRYRITKPLIAANWTGSAYGFITVEIYGDSKMWDVGSRSGSSVILADFKDGFALGLHLNKGSIVKGLHFEGLYRNKYDFRTHYKTTLANYKSDTTCRDTRYSPYAGLVIDPFRGQLPPDGGYPQLTSWYRGADSYSGSTGIRVEDVTSAYFTVAFLIAPNGRTLNAELLTFQNIRVGDCKVGFAGCQAQEKMNRIINVGAWGYTHTLFAWSIYGQGQPGHYYIEGVNIAGFVVQMIHRGSAGYFPITVTNVYAERLFKVGYWQGTSGDVFSNSLIDFMYPNEVGAYPDAHITGDPSNGLALNNVTMRYYGQFSKPMFLRGGFQLVNSPNPFQYLSPVVGWRNVEHPNLTMAWQGFPVFTTESNSLKTTINKSIPKGTIVFFQQANNGDFVGMGEVESSDSLSSKIMHISPTIIPGLQYKINRYN